jgi:lipopolysaccharide transport system ATP-binding protein
MGDIAIKAEGLSKLYRIGRREKYYTLRDTLVSMLRAPVSALREASFANGGGNTICALRDVSFEVKRGEVMGVIGRNGAGKTTLLKILSRITEPTDGYAEINGRVGSLLEVGTGFHPELTGRENIYLNGTILGMKKKEIDRRFDEILSFAEVEKFIDTPIKRYSSGMYMRLAFAVAAHLETEILLVDEILAVGDTAFQRKCLGKIKSVAQGGRTVLFVSHNMASIKNLCDSGFLLESGSLSKKGPIAEVVQSYLRSLENLECEVDLRDPRLHRGGRDIRIERVAIMDSESVPCARISFGEPFQVVLEASLGRDVSGLHVGLGIAAPDGTRLTTTHHSDTLRTRDFYKGKLILRCVFESNLLAPGIYYLHVGAHSEDSLGSDYVPDALTFEVLPITSGRDDDFQPRNFGLFRHPTRWVVEPNASKGAMKSGRSEHG